jgi:sporulation protein YlmC with PRC-barrel domain
MEKAGIKFFLLLTSALFVILLTYAEGLMGSQYAASEVGHGLESGLKIAASHDKTQKEEGYHHHKAGDPMESKQAKQILDKSVISEDGENLGTLHDLVIFGKGIVHYGVLALEDREDEYVAIPFNALESRDDDTLVLHMNAEKVKGAPTFSMEEITDWDNSNIGDKVHRYFGKEMKENSENSHGE